METFKLISGILLVILIYSWLFKLGELNLFTRDVRMSEQNIIFRIFCTFAVIIVYTIRIPLNLLVFLALVMMKLDITLRNTIIVFNNREEIAKIAESEQLRKDSDSK